MEPFAWNPPPLLAKVSLMLEEEVHWTGPAPPLQVSLMLYPLEMAVRLGAEHFWFGVAERQVWPALFAQTLT